MSDAKKGDLVQIRKIILEPSQRSDGLPPSTRKVPYACRIKGFLQDEHAMIGNKAEIETFIGRKISGILYQVNPTYDHGFGEPQYEILFIGKEVKHQLNQMK
jgi:hypothetical protein